MTKSRGVLSGRAEYWVVPAAIAAAAVSVQLSFHIPVEGGEPYAVIRAAIVVLPLAASVCCFAVALKYDVSRIFGRSFLVLGVAYAAVFIGEAAYYFYLDPAGMPDHAAVEALFLVSYPLFVLHVLINVSYFVQKVGVWWLLPCTVTLAVTVLYVLWTGAHPPYLDVLTVACSSALLGLAALAFVLFRGTALSKPWLVLLAGILLGTVGDVAYRHAHALGKYSFEDPSAGLWVASGMVVIYALYRHCRTF